MKSENKKIHLCFFSPASYPFFFPSKNIHGGAELQMFLLSEKLSEDENFKITFIVGNYKQKKKIFYKKIKIIRAFNLPKKENLISKLFKTANLFFLYFKINPDVIITTTANSIVGITCFYAKITRKKHIHRTAHLFDVNFRWIKNNGISGKLYKYGLLNANKIITQNAEHKELLFKNHAIKSEILRNGFEINSVQTVEKKFILWVGRFEKWKNPECFLELSKILKEYNFMMICPHEKGDFDAWNLFRKKTKSSKNLTFTGQIPFSEIQNYFNRAIIFINTSAAEGFPNTFLQAAQGKTPIISLNVNPENFLTDYNCGIFCKNDFDFMIEQTKKLLKNKNELFLKGENSYKYLKEKHDINTTTKKLKQIILKS